MFSERTLYCVLCVMFLLAPAMCDHVSSVFFFPDAARTSEYKNFTFIVANSPSSSDSINEIRLLVPEYDNEAEFRLYEIREGVPVENSVPGWFVPGSLVEEDEDGYIIGLTYVANSPFQLMPGDYVAISFFAMTPDDEDDYEFEIITTDSEGENHSDDIKVIIDDVYPDVWIEGRRGWSNEEVEIEIGCSDKGDPESGCNISSYGFYVSEQKECSRDLSDFVLKRSMMVSNHVWICATATDYASNRRVVGPREVKVDTFLPETIFSWPNEGSWQDASFSVSVKFKDEESGLDDCFYRISEFDGVWEEGQWKKVDCDETELPVFCDFEGKSVCRVEAYAVDAAGNEGERASRFFSIDKDYPKAVLDSVVPSKVLNEKIFVNGFVEVKGKAVDENLYRFVLEHDDIICVSEFSEQKSICSWDTEKGEDGKKELFLFVEDLSGKNNKDSLIVFVDNIPPKTLVDSFDFNGTHYFVEGNLSFDVSDPGVNSSGVEQTFYRVYSEEETVWENYSEPVELVLDEGGYNFEFFSIDSLGNKEGTVRTKIFVKKEESVLAGTARVVSRSFTNLPLLLVLLFDAFVVVGILVLLNERRIAAQNA